MPRLTRSWPCRRKKPRSSMTSPEVPTSHARCRTTSRSRSPRCRTPPEGDTLRRELSPSSERRRGGYLCREITPLLGQSLLDKHPVTIVGAGLDETIRSYAGGNPHIKMVGWVPSVAPYRRSSESRGRSAALRRGDKAKAHSGAHGGNPGLDDHWRRGPRPRRWRARVDRRRPGRLSRGGS